MDNKQEIQTQNKSEPVFTPTQEERIIEIVLSRLYQVLADRACGTTLSLEQKSLDTQSQ